MGKRPIKKAPSQRELIKKHNMGEVRYRYLNVQLHFPDDCKITNELRKLSNEWGLKITEIVKQAIVYYIQFLKDKKENEYIENASMS